MSPVTSTGTPRFQPLAYLRSVIARAKCMTAFNEDGEEDIRARRDFLNEMMQSHPEAFQSELDWQNMMYYYPSRF